MSDASLNSILSEARKAVHDVAAAKEEEQRKLVQVWDERAELLRRALLPRLQAAKAAWKESIDLTIQEQTTYNGALPERAPWISFHLGKHNANNPGVGGSSLYFFTVNERNAFHVYSGTDVRNSLDFRAGIKDGHLDNAVIDRVLAIAAREYFEHTKGPS